MSPAPAARGGDSSHTNQKAVDAASLAATRQQSHGKGREKLLNDKPLTIEIDSSPVASPSVVSEAMPRVEKQRSPGAVAARSREPSPRHQQESGGSEITKPYDTGGGVGELVTLSSPTAAARVTAVQTPWLYGSTVTKHALLLEWLSSEKATNPRTTDEFIFWNQRMGCMWCLFMAVSSVGMLTFSEQASLPAWLSSIDGLDDGAREAFHRANYLIFVTSVVILLFAVMLHLLQIVMVQQSIITNNFPLFRKTVGESTLLFPFACGIAGTALMCFGMAAKVLLTRPGIDSVIFGASIVLVLLAYDWFHRNMARAALMVEQNPAKRTQPPMGEAQEDVHNGVVVQEANLPKRSYLAEEVSAEEIYDVLRKYFLVEHGGNFSNLVRAEFVALFDIYDSETTTLMAGRIYDHWTEERIASMMRDPGF